MDGPFLPADWLNGLIGGVMIGAAAGLLLLGNGRIAGISGIFGGVLDGPRTVGRRDWTERLAFIGALMASPLLWWLVAGPKTIEVSPNLGLLAVAGVVVGVGVRLGSGCTSGHGVCGSARLSRRSLVAMATFMATAVGTVAVMNML